MMMNNADTTTPAMTELERKRAVKAVEEQKALEELEKLLPKPVGFRLLIALPNVDETYDSGLVKAAKTVRDEYILSILGVVLDMGSEAYSDKERFPHGPWCKVGDYVMFRVNSGTRFRVGGQEYRLLNDDSIEAVVPEPKAVTRAF